MQYVGMARIKSGRAFLYCISNNLSGKCYNGIASDPDDRWRRHLRAVNCNNHRQSIHRAMLKHGVDAFTFSIIATSPTWADGLATERSLIAQYDAKRNGYNSTDGGEGMHGLVHSAATRALIGSLSRGRKASEETRKKLSEMRTGMARPPTSMETRAKISATLTGRKLPPFTEAHRAALSVWHKGQKRKPLSEEHRAKISKVWKGKKRPPFSAEWREAIAAGMRGKKRGPYRVRDADIAPGAH